jgi:hypothetical protein
MFGSAAVLIGATVAQAMRLQAKKVVYAAR